MEERKLDSERIVGHLEVDRKRRRGKASNWIVRQLSRRRRQHSAQPASASSHKGPFVKRLGSPARLTEARLNGVIAEDVQNPTLTCPEERRDGTAERAILFLEGIERRPCFGGCACSGGLDSVKKQRGEHSLPSVLRRSLCYQQIRHFACFGASLRAVLLCRFTLWRLRFSQNYGVGDCPQRCFHGSPPS